MERIKKAIDRARKEREGTSVNRDVPTLPRVKKELPDKIEYTQTRTIEVSPEVFRRNRIVTHTNDGTDKEAFKLLRTQILQRMRANNWNALAVSSAKPGEGKSLIAVNLAIALAMEVNQTVLLVDMDMRRPSIHKYFGYKPEKGISDYILHDTPLNEILFTPDIERLVVLPGNTALTNSSERLSSPKMVSLVNELKNRYPSRIIIFDLPPLLPSDDTLIFSPYVDAILIVAEEGETTKEELKQVKETLRETEIIGTVLNKSRLNANEQY